LIDSHQYLYKYAYTIIFVGFVSLIAIESLSIQLPLTNPVQHAIAQSSLSTNTSLLNDNSEKQNNSKMIKAFGHFANNQIKDGIVTWIQGGFWELKINNITNDSSSNLNNNNNILINNNNGKADFIANFTMIKPDGSLSHNHNIDNFISSKVILTDKDIVVMGIADIYSDDNHSEYKSVPLTIHLMGNKVLGLTIDVSKTEGHFSSQNELFGTLISGIGLNSSNDSVQTKMHHDTATNDTVEKESMTMMQQH
jgi:hypothetical protein